MSAHGKAVEKTDVLVIGSGFGGSIPAYHLAAGGAKVVVLERGPRLTGDQIRTDLGWGTWNRLLDFVMGDGMTAIAGNCVGGGSAHYFAVSLRAPSFAFRRRGGMDRPLWPGSITRATLDPWYERAEESIPISEQKWPDVSYAGGLFAAACRNAGRTCQPVPLAVDLDRCTNCNFMFMGCRYDAKRSMYLNYLAAAEAHGARVRPLHEVQSIGPATTPGYRYRMRYSVLADKDYFPQGGGAIEAKVVVVAAGAMATPVLLRRSEAALGSMPRAVGRHLSGNGDGFTATAMNEDRIRSVLKLERAPGTPYRALPIGRSITSMTHDRLDPGLPEFERFSIQQCYLPPLANGLLEVPGEGWFGPAHQRLRRNWASMLTTLIMAEDDNEGVFGAPPPAGAFVRYTPGVGISPLRYRANAHTRRAQAAALAEHRAILEKDGLGKVYAWSDAPAGVVTAHPLSSARIGDDPALSACDDRHELRGHEGIFVTDGSAVPGALCVNPTLTISALAERAVPFIVERLAGYGVDVSYGAPAPDGSTAGRRATLPFAGRR